LLEDDVVKCLPVKCRQGMQGSKGVAALILNLASRWRWVFKATRRPSYPWEPVVPEAWWALRLLLTGVEEGKSLSTTRFQTPNLVAGGESLYRQASLVAFCLK